MNGHTGLPEGPWLDGTRHSFVFLGEAGSGKSEIAISFARALAQADPRPVHFFDLDMTKPLFRSRDAGKELERTGVTVHYQEQFMDAPTLVGGVMPTLRDENRLAVLDVGGDPSGARVLARYRARILKEDYQLLYVVNARRPEVRTAERSVEYLRGIEAVTGLRCTGLVNNTHLCGETTAEDIRQGAALAEEVSRRTNIPVRCHIAEARFQDQLRDLPLFPIHIQMKKPWE